MELQNLETELRLLALADKIPTPPTIRNAQTPEERQKAWEAYVLTVYYKRQMGNSPV